MASSKGKVSVSVDNLNVDLNSSTNPGQEPDHDVAIVKAERRMGFYRRSSMMTKAHSDGSLPCSRNSMSQSQSPIRRKGEPIALTTQTSSNSPKRSGRRNRHRHRHHTESRLDPGHESAKNVAASKHRKRRESIFFNPYSLDIILDANNQVQKINSSSTTATIGHKASSTRRISDTMSTSRGYKFLYNIASVFHDDYIKYELQVPTQTTTENVTSSMALSSSQATIQATNANATYSTQMDTCCMILDSVKMKGCRFLKEWDTSSMPSARGVNDIDLHLDGCGDARYYEVDDFVALTAIKKLLQALSTSTSTT